MEAPFVGVDFSHDQVTNHSLATTVNTGSTAVRDDDIFKLISHRPWSLLIISSSIVSTDVT